jgi:predicted dehydrogenase/threonine dehydrogenase-like Zn-dependent dehydrogenase
MKQIVQDLKTGAVSVIEVPPPMLRPGGALVASLASVISPGTERSKVELAQKSLLGKARARPELARQVVEKARQEGIRETYRTVMGRLETPVPLGYSASGIVEELSPDCEGVQPGDLVAGAGGGYANHASVNFVPANLLARVPAGVSAEQAAYGTIGAIALHGVRQAELQVGQAVAVIGLGLVGLLTAQIARASGARVLGVDLEPAACALATRLGAEVAVPRSEPVEAIAASFSDGMGMDAVLVCASTPSAEPLALAASIARDRARVVVVGVVGMSLPRDRFYEKELELRMSRSYGPGRYDPAYEEHGHDYPVGYVRWTEQRNLAEFLRLVASGAVDVDALTSHRLPLERASEAYALVAGEATDSDRPVGVVLTYGRSEHSPRRLEIGERPARRRRETVRVGLVGAGSFATRILLPALASDQRVELLGVASATGVTARHVASRFGFGFASTDPEALIACEDVDTVVVATRHDSHAELAAHALAAGKTVFCEKPLATTAEGLEHVAAAAVHSAGSLLVGFNRRFSPLSAPLRAALPAGVPRAITYRVNAGRPTPGHWTADPVIGGGRLVGEVCHFLDFACYLAEQPPVAVSGMALGDERDERDDSVLVQVLFGCGSVASIQYLANGDPTVPKERVEVFCGGVVAAIDDFRTLEVVRDGRRRRRSSRKQQKGHREEMDALVGLARGERCDLLPVEAALWSSALTLQAQRALREGSRVPIELPHSGGNGADGKLAEGAGASRESVKGLAV